MHPENRLRNSSDPGTMPAKPNQDGRRLILASSSPRRLELLKRTGLPFVVQTAEVDEDTRSDADPVSIACANSRLKATAVAKLNPDAIVLGADTVVCLGGHVFHKPADMVDAQRMLEKLSGKTHTVTTAVTIVSPGGESIFHVDTPVTFKHLDTQTILDYFSHVDPLDKAGAYGIQSHAETIIANVGETIDNVMGLPVDAVLSKLAEHGYPALPFATPMEQRRGQAAQKWS